MKLINAKTYNAMPTPKQAHWRSLAWSLTSSSVLSSVESLLNLYLIPSS